MFWGYLIKIKYSRLVGDVKEQKKKKQIFFLFAMN